MPRKPPLQGVPRQLKEAARLNLDPSEIAREIDEFDQVLSLPRFVRQEGWDALDDLSKATELVTVIVAELEQMKPPSLDESKAEQHQRNWRTKLIDGTYALTEEWQNIPRLTPRREKLIEERPGREPSMRTYIRNDEREVHEELAERLSRGLGPATGLTILDAACGLLEEFSSASNADAELQLWTLFVYAANQEILDLAKRLVTRLIVEKERSDSDAPAEIGWILFKSPGPSFTQREDSALLTARGEQPTRTFHPFLEYLEAHPTGRQVIETWKDWLATADWDAVRQPLVFAHGALNEGFGTDALQEIENTETLDPIRSHRELFYLIGIGAILGERITEGQWYIQPLWRFRYWPRTERDCGKAPPDGWIPVSREVLDRD